MANGGPTHAQCDGAVEQTALVPPPPPPPSKASPSLPPAPRKPRVPVLPDPHPCAA